MLRLKKALWQPKLLILLVAVAAALNAVSCNRPASQRSVVIYTSVDQVFSEPVLQKFQERTGITVKVVYDVEATKTVGLANRLLAEKNNPQADVFWSGEFVETIRLKEQGILAPYRSPSVADLPGEFIDAGNYWTGFGGRARVLLINTNLLTAEQAPRSLLDLVEARYPGKSIGLAYPVFGTTSTHAAALYAALGPEQARSWFRQVKERGIQIADGNSTIKDLVANGKLAMGMVDTDDALVALNKGKPVAVVFLDQQERALGTLIIPNTVALIAKGPHPEEARALADYLLASETEDQLIDAGWIDVPSRPFPGKNTLTSGKQVKPMKVSFQEIYNQLESSRKDLQEIFIR